MFPRIGQIIQQLSGVLIKDLGARGKMKQYQIQLIRDIGINLFQVRDPVVKNNAQVVSGQPPQRGVVVMFELVYDDVPAPRQIDQNTAQPEEVISENVLMMPVAEIKIYPAVNI